MLPKTSRRSFARQLPSLAASATSFLLACLLVPSAMGLTVGGVAATPSAHVPVASASAATPALPSATATAPVSAAVGESSLPIGVAAGSVAYTLAPWANYAASGYHKLLGEAQVFGPAAYDPMTKSLWISQTDPSGYEISSPILTVNATTLDPTGMVTSVSNSSGLVYVPSNHAMYVSDPGTGEVLEVNATTGAVEAQVAVGTTGATPGNLSFDPVRDTLYVTVESNDTVAQISAVTNTVVGWSVGLGEPLGGISYDAATGDVAVTTPVGVDWLNGISLYFRTALAIGGTPESVATDQNGYAYVGTEGGDATVVNLTRTVAGPLGLGGSNVMGAVFDPGIPAVVFTDLSTDEITVVSSLTQTVVAEYPIASDDPSALVLVPATHQVDVLSSASLYTQFTTTGYGTANALGDTVQAVDDLTGAVNVSSRNLAASPTSLTYDPDGGEVVVADQWSNNLSFVNAANPSTVGDPQVFVNGSAGEVGYDPVTHTLWVPIVQSLNGCCGGWTSDGVLLVLNASTGALVTILYPSPVNEGGPHTWNNILGVQFDPGTGTMLVFYNNNGPVQLELEEYDASTYAELSPTPLVFGTLVAPSNDLPDLIPSWALDPSTHQLFVTSPYTDQLFIANTQSFTLTTVLNVGTTPQGVAYDSADGDVYVANFGSSNMTIVNATTDLVVVPSLPFEGDPEYVVYDPNTELLYVGVQAGVGLWPINLETTLVVLDGSSLGAVWGPWPTIYVGYYNYLTPESAIFVPSTVPGTPGQIWNSNTYDGSVTVISIPPWVTSLVASPTVLGVGQPMSLTASLVGGTDGWTASYSGLPAGCTSASTLLLLCTPTAPGSYNVTLTVTDGFGRVSSAWATFTVAAGLSVSATVSPGGTDVGLPVYANATATGGTGTDVFEWSFGDGTVASAADSSHVYTSPGTYAVSVTVVDGTGDLQSWSTAISIAPDPTVTASVLTDTPTVDAPVQFAASVTGGTAPWSSVEWSFGGGGHATGNDPVHTFAAPGTYTVFANVTDGVGVAGSDEIMVTVGAPAALEVTLVPGANQSYPGTPVTLVALVSGGIGGDTYAWSLNGTAVPGATASDLTWTPAGAGSYTLSVTVTDSASDTASAKVVVDVLPWKVVTVAGPTEYKTQWTNSSTPASLATLAPYLGGGIVVGLVLGLLLGMMMRRTRSAGPPPPPARPGKDEEGPSTPSTSTPSASAPTEEPVPSPSG